LSTSSAARGAAGLDGQHHRRAVQGMKKWT
jgi:hypothetical protein